MRTCSTSAPPRDPVTGRGMYDIVFPALETATVKLATDLALVLPTLWAGTECYGFKQ